MSILRRIQRRRFRRAMHVRNSVGKGTAERPRVSIFRSLRHMYAQAIDDASGKTIAAASSLELKKEGSLKGNKSEVAAEVGRRLARKLLDGGVSAAIFDRGRFKYHGRVKALCEAMREAGLKI